MAGVRDRVALVTGAGSAGGIVFEDAPAAYHAMRAARHFGKLVIRI